MPKSYRTCEIVQQLEYLTLSDIENGLDHNAIKDYAYILHDKDIDISGNLKSPHWHIYIRFKDSVPTESICKWFNINDNYINKIKGRFADALAYATHKNCSDKYQYPDEEVKSNFDFKKEVESISSRNIDKVRKQEIVSLITSGIIRQYNYFDYISPDEYIKFKNVIDNAFAYRSDTLTYSHRNLDVIYIWGDSGVGKTTYAKELAEKKGYSYYISSCSNDLLDGYKGQDCLILDELRSNYIDISDLLKLLDNHTGSTIKSRYRNKILECKLIIITTSCSIESFFGCLHNGLRESIIQLKRRCKYYIRMDKGSIKTYIYQPFSDKYDYVSTFNNHIYERFSVSDISHDDALEDIKNMLCLETELNN